MNFTVPTRNEFAKGCNEYVLHDRRDAMYKVATFLLKHSWGNPSDMADGLGVLLLTWNQAFYRYGTFDFDQLEECMRKHLALIEQFRNRYLGDFRSSDGSTVIRLFRDFLDALKIADGKAKGRKSPVAVAKALHLLAPQFFPLWDDRIARAYDCYYDVNSAEKYLSFCNISKDLIKMVEKFNPPPSSKTIVKLLDEYNFAKYTKGWI